MTRRSHRTEVSGKDGDKSPKRFQAQAQDVGQDARRVRYGRSGEGDVLMRFNVHINPSSTRCVYSLLMSYPCQDITLEVIKGCDLRVCSLLERKKYCPCPGQLPPHFGLGLNYSCWGRKGKPPEFYWGTGGSPTEGLWEQANSTLLSGRAAVGAKS